MTAAEDPRIDAILDVLLAFARQDFTRKAPIGSGHDSIDAVAAGLNMLAEELHGEVASRRELENAYRALTEAQARLVHGGKLVAIGQLASGVAHEINNPASWILASIGVLDKSVTAARTELADRALDAEELRTRALATLDTVATWLRDATDGMQRILAVTRDLRTFSRADADDVELVRVADLVRSAVRLAKPVLQGDARVDIHLDDTATVLGSPGRLGQVVTNLLVNAAHAVASSGCSARMVSSANAHCVRIEVGRREQSVVVAVDDSGAGVPAELRQRVFEPFFTTKGQEEGTGLGLSLVAEIVHRHGGQVRVLDSPLGGARFEVTLPFAPAPAPVAVAPPATTQRPRLLVIDDEPRLLQTLAIVLRDRADVHLANNGREALHILARDRAFDAIVCDLQMPELDGPGFFEHVRTMSPELTTRILFTSGGVFRSSVREFLVHHPVPVLEKPVRDDVLLAAVARLMSTT